MADDVRSMKRTGRLWNKKGLDNLITIDIMAITYDWFENPKDRYSNDAPSPKGDIAAVQS